jgi:hypothetical protein
MAWEKRERGLLLRQRFGVRVVRGELVGVTMSYLGRGTSPQENGNERATSKRTYDTEHLHSASSARSQGSLDHGNLSNNPRGIRQQRP